MNLSRMLLVILCVAVVNTVAYAQVMPDSLLFYNSHPVIFPVSSTRISPEDSTWINDELLPALLSLGPDGVIVGRASASPEGTWSHNTLLAQGRRDAALRYLTAHGFDASRILFECVPEDYQFLARMMQQAEDPDYEIVHEIIERCGDDHDRLKFLLRRVDGGKLWRRVLREYYPQLRAVRILATDRVARDFIPELPAFTAFPVEPAPQIVIPSQWPTLDFEPQQRPVVTSRHRRELLAHQTNLLLWGAYVPQYGWCPMPNVALEYYPRHGHFTYGASFDCPWWIGNTTNHKYFELRQYQLYTRYYLRNSDSSYSDDACSLPAYGKAAFSGLYAQAYVNNFLYQIGFSAKKGWIGEGLGGGLGAGYVMPISRDGHWRLDFGLQVGLFWTQYDPFVYGKPVYHGGEIDGNYYYNTDLYRPDFVKRQHRYTWFGPTRVGITLSYDLLYRRHDHRSPSFRPREKGVKR